MRTVDPLPAGSSLQVAAERLRQEGTDLLPVVEKGRLVGVVTQESLGRCLGEGRLPADPVDFAMIRTPAIVAPEAPGAEALRGFAQTGGASAVVADGDGLVLGVISPVDLYRQDRICPRPALVGGMATPFGVYLTTGAIRAGAKDWALVLTGALMFLMFSGAVLAASYVAKALLPPSMHVQASDALAIALFLLTMRVVPLSGIHAAEHKVVHAIERGEDLDPEIVRRMPRVHPRCGTNVAVAISLFIGIGSARWLPSQELQILLALVATLALWRPLGGLAQLLVTTRPPSEAHIAMGIRAGEELLERYSRSAHGRPTFVRRLWCSGMFHVIAGSFVAFAALWAIARAFGIEMVL